MAPVPTNCASPAQVQAVANQVTALQTSVNTLAARVDALALEVQKLGDGGTSAVNNLSVKIDQLLAR